MKAKQILSKAFVATMVFSAMFGTPVMAEEIDSSTIFVDQEVIDVTLPTTASQKFYIDPQGLIAIGKGGTAAANPGTVVGASDMYAVNRSSIPLALSVSYKLVDSAASDGVEIKTAVADTTASKAIQDATTKQIAVSVSAEESSADDDSNTCGGKVFKATTTGVDITGTTGNLSAADLVYAGDSTTAATADYLMTAETYKAQLKDGKTTADAYDSSAYEYVVDSTAEKASCVKLSIGGYCSQKADWSDYADGTESLKLDVVFKFKKVETTKGDYTDTKVSSTEVEAGPKVTIAANGSITITGLTAAKNITGLSSVTLVKGSDTAVLQASAATFDGSGWTAEQGGSCTLQLGRDWSAWNNSAVSATVTLTDGSSITSNSVTLNVQ